MPMLKPAKTGRGGLNGYVPVDILDTDTIMELYSLRWQVELFIKRLKSLLDIDMDDLS
jgi:hypothetical protein